VNILTGGIVLIFLPCEIARALHGFSTIDKATSASPPPFRTVFTRLPPFLARSQARPSCSGGCSSPRCYEIGRREKIRRLRTRVSIHPHGHLVCLLTLPPPVLPEVEAEPSDPGKNGSLSEIWGARTAGRYCFTLCEIALHLPGGVTYEKHRNPPRGRKTFIKSLRNELERLLRDLTTYVRVYEVLPKEHRPSESGESEDENVSSHGTLPSQDIIAGNLIPRLGGANRTNELVLSSMNRERADRDIDNQIEMTRQH